MIKNRPSRKLRLPGEQESPYAREGGRIFQGSKAHKSRACIGLSENRKQACRRKKGTVHVQPVLQRAKSSGGF